MKLICIDALEIVDINANGSEYIRRIGNIAADAETGVLYQFFETGALCPCYDENGKIKSISKEQLKKAIAENRSRKAGNTFERHKSTYIL